MFDKVIQSIGGVIFTYFIVFWFTHGRHTSGGISLEDTFYIFIACWVIGLIYYFGFEKKKDKEFNEKYYGTGTVEKYPKPKYTRYNKYERKI